MINNLRTARQENGGFTLVELLIVIVVLGILAGITVFGVANFKADATNNACKANVKVVQTAAEAFNAQTGLYPADMTALTGAGYIKSAPVAPAADTWTFSTTAAPTTTATCS